MAKRNVQNDEEIVKCEEQESESVSAEVSNNLSVQKSTDQSEISNDHQDESVYEPSDSSSSLAEKAEDSISSIPSHDAGKLDDSAAVSANSSKSDDSSRQLSYDANDSCSSENYSSSVNLSVNISSNDEHSLNTSQVLLHDGLENASDLDLSASELCVPSKICIESDYPDAGICESFVNHVSLEADCSSQSSDILSNSTFNVGNSLDNAVNLPQMHCVSIEVVAEDRDSADAAEEVNHSHIQKPKIAKRNSVPAMKNKNKPLAKNAGIIKQVGKSPKNRTMRARRITAKMKQQLTKELETKGHLICPIQGCHQKYITVANFLTHYKYCTGKKTLQHCPYCHSLIFSGKEAVLQHMQVEHPENVQQYKEEHGIEDESDTNICATNVVPLKTSTIKNSDKGFKTKMNSFEKNGFSPKEIMLSEKKTALKPDIKTIERTMNQNYKEFKQCVRFNHIVETINSVCDDEIVSEEVKSKKFTSSKPLLCNKLKKREDPLPEEVPADSPELLSDQSDSVDCPSHDPENVPSIRKVTTKSRIVLNTQGYERFSEYLKVTRDWASERRTYSRNKSGDNSLNMSQSDTSLPHEVQDTYQLSESLEHTGILSVDEPELPPVVNEKMSIKSSTEKKPRNTSAVELNHTGTKYKLNFIEDEIHSLRQPSDNAKSRFSTDQNSPDVDPDVNYGHMVFSKPNKVANRERSTCYDNAGNFSTPKTSSASEMNSEKLLQKELEKEPAPLPVIDFQTLLETTIRKKPDNLSQIKAEASEGKSKQDAKDCDESQQETKNLSESQPVPKNQSESKRKSIKSESKRKAKNQGESKQEAKKQSESKQEAKKQSESKPETEGQSDPKRKMENQGESKKDAKDQNESNQDAKDQNKSQQDAKDQTESKQDANDQTESKLDAKDQTESKLDAKDQTESKQDANDQNESKQETQNESESRHEAKDSSESGHVEKDLSESRQQAESHPPIQEANSSKEKIKKGIKYRKKDGVKLPNVTGKESKSAKKNVQGKSPMKNKSILPDQDTTKECVDGPGRKKRRNAHVGKAGGKELDADAVLKSSCIESSKADTQSSKMDADSSKTDAEEGIFPSLKSLSLKSLLQLAKKSASGGKILVSLQCMQNDLIKKESGAGSLGTNFSVDFRTKQILEYHLVKNFSIIECGVPFDKTIRDFCLEFKNFATICDTKGLSPYSWSAEQFFHLLQLDYQGFVKQLMSSHATPFSYSESSYAVEQKDSQDHIKVSLLGVYNQQPLLLSNTVPVIEGLQSQQNNIIENLKQNVNTSPLKSLPHSVHIARKIESPTLSTSAVKRKRGRPSKRLQNETPVKDTNNIPPTVLNIISQLTNSNIPPADSQRNSVQNDIPEQNQCTDKDTEPSTSDPVSVIKRKRGRPPKRTHSEANTPTQDTPTHLHSPAVLKDPLLASNSSPVVSQGNNQIENSQSTPVKEKALEDSLPKNQSVEQNTSPPVKRKRGRPPKKSLTAENSASDSVQGPDTKKLLDPTTPTHAAEEHEGEDKENCVQKNPVSKELCSYQQVSNSSKVLDTSTKNLDAVKANDATPSPKQSPSVQVAVRKSTRLIKRKIDPDTILIPHKKSQTLAAAQNSSSPETKKSHAKPGRPRTSKGNDTPLLQAGSTSNDAPNNSLTVDPSEKSDKVSNTEERTSQIQANDKRKGSRKGRPRKCVRYADLNSGIDSSDNSLLGNNVPKISGDQKCENAFKTSTNTNSSDLIPDAKSVEASQSNEMAGVQNCVPKVHSSTSVTRIKPKSQYKFGVKSFAGRKWPSLQKKKGISKFNHRIDGNVLKTHASGFGDKPMANLRKPKAVVKAKKRVCSDATTDAGTGMRRGVRSAALKAQELFGALREKSGSVVDSNKEDEMDEDFIVKNCEKRVVKRLLKYKEYFTESVVERRAASSEQISNWINQLECSGKIICESENCKKVLGTKAGMIYHYEQACLQAKNKWTCKLCQAHIRPFSATMLKHFKKVHPKIYEKKQISSYRLKEGGKNIFIVPSKDKQLSFPDGRTLPYSNLLKPFEKPFGDWLNELQTRRNCYEPMESSVFLKEYIPFLHSAKFLVHNPKTKEESEWFSLSPFESHPESVGSYQATFSTGGPVCCCSWIPMPKEQSKQYLAVATSKEVNKFHHGLSSEKEKCVLQVWDCGDLKDSVVATQPTLGLAIPLNYGKIWHLSCCSASWQDPSSVTKCDDPSKDLLPRLGVVALACGDGCIRIISLPHPDSLSRESNQLPVYTAKPIALLKQHTPSCSSPSLSKPAVCTALCWQKQDDRQLVACGYSTGMVSIWSISTCSTLLPGNGSNPSPSEDKVILPFITFQAHLSTVHSVEFPALGDSRYIATCSSDKTLKVFDLVEPYIPVMEFKKGLCRAMGSPSIGTGVFLCFNETLHSKTSVSYQDFGILSKKLHLVDNNSYVQGFSVSEHTNIVAVGDVSGRVIASTLNCLNVEQLNVTHQQYPVFRTELRPVAGESREADDPSTSNRGLAFIDTSLSDPASVEREIAQGEQDSSDINSLISSDWHPNSITTVSWNPNEGSQYWLFAANEAGIARIVCTPGLKSQCT